MKITTIIDELSQSSKIRNIEIEIIIIIKKESHLIEILETILE